MGENNAYFIRRDRISSDTFLATAALYQQLYKRNDDHESQIDKQVPQQGGDDETDLATVQVIIKLDISMASKKFFFACCGWVPTTSQL